MKFKYLIAGVAVAALFVSAGSTAYAFWGFGQDQQKDSIVTAIAQKFSLNPEEVQKVFEEKRGQMFGQKAEVKEKMQEKCAERVAEAVAGGKITQEQANLISAKKLELEALRTSLEGKSPEEIKTAMQAQKDLLRQWAEQNNIPLEYMPGSMGKGFGSCGAKKMGGFGKGLLK